MTRQEGEGVGFHLFTTISKIWGIFPTFANFYHFSYKIG